MLRFTGHPIADVGVATVTAFCGKRCPEDLGEEDLAAVAEYLGEQYVTGTLTPYLSCVFTTNAAYTQPSWDRKRRTQEARELLFSFRSGLYVAPNLPARAFPTRRELKPP